MKDNATGDVKVTYYSSCLRNGPLVQTNKCDGLNVGTVVNFTAKIEVYFYLKIRKYFFKHVNRFYLYQVVQLPS